MKRGKTGYESCLLAQVVELLARQLDQVLAGAVAQEAAGHREPVRRGSETAAAVSALDNFVWMRRDMGVLRLGDRLRVVEEVMEGNRLLLTCELADVGRGLTQLYQLARREVSMLPIAPNDARAGDVVVLTSAGGADPAAHGEGAALLRPDDLAEPEPDPHPYVCGECYAVGPERHDATCAEGRLIARQHGVDLEGEPVLNDGDEDDLSAEEEGDA